MTFLSTKVQHPSKECESLFCISLKNLSTPKKEESGNKRDEEEERRKQTWMVLNALVG